MPVFTALQTHPVLSTLSLPQVLQFLWLSSYLKEDILLCQPVNISVDCAPDILPLSVTSFLSDATSIPLSHIDTCWSALKDDVWLYPMPAEVHQEDEQAFVDHGWARGLCDYHRFLQQIVLGPTTWPYSNISAGRWQFGTLLTTDHVWDSFIILTLLDLHKRNNTCLQVPHTGDQKDRFTAAMAERNLYVIQYGQDGADHFCKKCMRTWEDTDGTMRKCQVIVSDGINMGIPCCGSFRCTDPLTNNRHRFCTEHFWLHGVCAVDGCDNLVVPGTKTCTLQAHSEMERLHNECGKAAFTLKDRLQKHWTTHRTNNATVPEASADAEEDIEDDIETFEVDETGQVRMHMEKHPGSIGVVDDPDECAGRRKQ
ncbi:hypothetical protein MSAN_01602600 [Mycena sanguinolenta]|uniref:CxC6 like cysteine cluster associated with KDZ domain-containing protein n=1 Tax=Mycena sanguinolenta TaxID=230812 RepID=A0A8H6Y4A3_9AGAR|nr:hypothetical protein MSAN_01602600 [Mycena sanguinolenta]